MGGCASQEAIIEKNKDNKIEHKIENKIENIIPCEEEKVLVKMSYEEIVAKALEGITDTSDKIKKVDEILESYLNNKEYIDSLSSLDKEQFGLRKLDAVDLSKERPLDYKYENNPFSWKKGGTTSVAYTIYEEQKKNNPKILIQVFADQTFCGCGVLSHWKTQEESTLRDTNPELLGWLRSQGYIAEMDKKKHFKYNLEGKKVLSTSDGYLINGKLSCVNLKPLEKPIEFIYLFSSMPSLSGDSLNFDVQGTVSWMQKYRKISNMDPVDNEIAKELVTDFYGFRRHKEEKYKSYEDLFKLTEDEFHKAMMILMFTDEYTFPENQGLDTIMKTIEEIRKLASDEDEEIYEEAEDNYKKTVRASIRAWIIAARKKGVKYFIGGAIGCGAFHNDPEIVGQLIAEEFIQHGGGMNYVYAAYSGAKDKMKGIFEKQFNEAYDKLYNEDPEEDQNSDNDYRK